jgi:hypothetical protein
MLPESYPIMFAARNKAIRTAKTLWHLVALSSVRAQPQESPSKLLCIAWAGIVTPKAIVAPAAKRARVVAKPKQEPAEGALPHYGWGVYGSHHDHDMGESGRSTQARIWWFSFGWAQLGRARSMGNDAMSVPLSLVDLTADASDPRLPGHVDPSNPRRPWDIQYVCLVGFGQCADNKRPPHHHSCQVHYSYKN